MSPKKRFAVLYRCGFRCVYCGRRPPEVELEVDHFIPVTAGGEEIDENYVAACRECNIGKGVTIIRDDIVLVLTLDGRINHEKSLKRSGLWKGLDFPFQARLLVNPTMELSDDEIPHHVKAYDFRERSHAWLTRNRTQTTGTAA